jgi:hypothetical protein
MANPPKLDLVHLAIRSGIYGHIQWQDAAARRVRGDPDMAGYTPEGIRALLRAFVLHGGTLTARTEMRPEYLEANPDDPYWYRAILPAPPLPHGLFLELRLIDDDPKEPWVEIVNAHPQTP